MLTNRLFEKKICQKTISALVILIKMERKRSLPEKILEDVEAATSSLLPKKSRDAYYKELNEFNYWKEENDISGVSEDVLLAYFFNAKKRFSASSLWTKYSMLKSTLRLHETTDISQYGRLIGFLKNESKNHKPKKAKVLERGHIQEFLTKAPNKKYLMMKVALIFGVSGGCRCNELVNMSIDNVNDKGSYMLVSVPDTKTYVWGSFTIMEEGFSVNVLDICRKYMSLRPKNLSHDRLFLSYRNEKCTVQPVGINTLSKIPSEVAAFLKLQEPESYTGHSMRRTSATLLSNAGGDLGMVQRHGRWKSTTVAQGYIEESISSKIDIAKKILGENSGTKRNIDVDTENKLTEYGNNIEVENKLTEYGNNIEVNKNEANNVISFNINVNVRLDK